MLNYLVETTLPNEQKVFCFREKEASILYEQIQEYFQCGIEIREGDTILDVGANIGLFALEIYRRCRQNVTLYAFEPIPATFQVLEANARRFDPERIKVFPYGISNRSGNVTFASFPNATALSTSDIENLPEITRQITDTILRDLENATPRFRWIRWFPAFLRPFLVRYQLKPILRVEPVTCTVKTISEILREQSIERIDLLKIDVEKAELDVLLGIDAEDWPKIKQVVIEVHDIDRRLSKIQDLVEGYGLRKIVVKQEPIFVGTNIFNLYASR